MGQSISEAVFSNCKQHLALPAHTIISPSTAGTKLGFRASTLQPSTEPVVVPVPQLADATQYLGGSCLN